MLRAHVVPFGNQTVKTCYHHLKIISRIRRNLTSEACAAAVRALVLPGLDYANSLLVGVPEAVLQRLQVLQNNATRLIQLGVSGRAHITPVLRDLHWLPTRQRIRHKLLSLTYRALNCTEAPKYLASALEWRRTTRQLRSSGRQLVVPRTRRGAVDRSLDVDAPRPWSALPDSVKLAESFTSSKKHLKTLLFREHFGT